MPWTFLFDYMILHRKTLKSPTVATSANKIRWLNGIVLSTFQYLTICCQIIVTFEPCTYFTLVMVFQQRRNQKTELLLVVKTRTAPHRFQRFFS